MPHGHILRRRAGPLPLQRQELAAEGIPVLVVDEEIYRRLPTLLIATVDKFAQMPWNGKVQMLFGQVDGYCDRHGFRSPKSRTPTRTPRKTSIPGQDGAARPAATARSHHSGRVASHQRPPGYAGGSLRDRGGQLCSWEVERQDRSTQSDRLHGDNSQGR